MYKELKEKHKNIAVLGLGYVGLPLALAFAKKYRVIGFDIDDDKLEQIKRKQDPNGLLQKEDFEGCDIEFTSSVHDLYHAHFYVVTVPTDVDKHKVPNLGPLQEASEIIGRVIKKGDYVVYESTTYPGCTEEDCIPIIETESELKAGVDFKFGYSPERINPGEKEQKIGDILKIVSGNNLYVCDEIAAIYGEIIPAGIYKAPSIKVAEAAKVIENTQRDLNISLMNELSMLFDKIGVDTHEVLKAAKTKWNFVHLTPGLVGGHCIAVDPYYLLHKAKKVGYDPQVILSGRRINDMMPAYIAKKLVQTLIQQGKNPSNCKVLIMGITFKENISDIRNSKVADLVRELQEFSVNVEVSDPKAKAKELLKNFNIKLLPAVGGNYDAVVLAVGHNIYKVLDFNWFRSICTEKNPIFFDLKANFNRADFEPYFSYWRL